MQAHYKLALKVISCNLSRHLRSLYDPEDFVQMAYAEAIEKDKDLKWLKRIAKSRMIDAYRAGRTQRRTPRLLPVTEPSTPHELIEADELLDELVVRAGPLEGGHVQSPEVRRAIIALTGQGYTAIEVAERVGCHRQCVYDFLRVFRREYSP